MTDGMLPFCQKEGLTPGTILTVREHSPEQTVCEGDNGLLKIPAAFVPFLRWEAY